MQNHLKSAGRLSNVCIRSILTLYFHLSMSYLGRYVHSFDSFCILGPFQSLGFLHFDLDELKRKRGPVLHRIIRAAHRYGDFLSFRNMFRVSTQ